MKLNIPGITFKSFVFAPMPHGLICGFFILCYTICWRTQLAVRGRAVGLPNEEIGQLESVKYTAGPLINHFVPTTVLGTQAILDTLVWEPTLLDPTVPRSEKEALVLDLAEELAQDKRSGKILNPKQQNPESIPIHRRGLLTQIKGKISQGCIFRSNAIIQGMDVHNLNFSQFFSIFLELCNTLGIKVEVLAICFHPDNFSFQLGCITASGLDKLATPPQDAPSPVTRDSLEKMAFAYLQAFLANLAGSKGILTFNDGVPFSYEPDNLAPIEIGLPIKRLQPPTAITGVAVNPDDPFSELISKQAKEINASIKGVKTPKTSASQKPKPTANNKADGPSGPKKGRRSPGPVSGR